MQEVLSYGRRLSQSEVSEHLLKANNQDLAARDVVKPREGAGKRVRWAQLTAEGERAGRWSWGRAEGQVQVSEGQVALVCLKEVALGAGSTGRGWSTEREAGPLRVCVCWGGGGWDEVPVNADSRLNHGLSTWNPAICVVNVARMLLLLSEF